MPTSSVAFSASPSSSTPSVLTTPKPVRQMKVASVGLRVSVSHDVGEITCEICMQFDDAICRYAICGYAICALVRQEMRQSVRAKNV